MPFHWHVGMSLLLQSVNTTVLSQHGTLYDTSHELLIVQRKFTIADTLGSWALSAVGTYQCARVGVLHAYLDTHAIRLRGHTDTSKWSWWLWSCANMYSVAVQYCPYNASISSKGISSSWNYHQSPEAYPRTACTYWVYNVLTVCEQWWTLVKHEDLYMSACMNRFYQPGTLCAPGWSYNYFESFVSVCLSIGASVTFWEGLGTSQW